MCSASITFVVVVTQKLLIGKIRLLLQTWRDEFVGWNPSEWWNITTVEIRPSLIWLPDIALLNRYQSRSSSQMFSLNSLNSMTKLLNNLKN